MRGSDYARRQWSGPMPPPGFFAVPTHEADEASSAGEGAAVAGVKTVPPRCRRAPASQREGLGLVAECDLLEGDIVFEDALCFTGDVTPHVVAATAQRAAQLIPRLVPSNVSGAAENGGAAAAVREFHTRAGALWRLFADTTTAAEPGPSTAAASTNNNAGGSSALFLDDDNLLVAAPGAAASSAAAVAGAASAKARAFAVAVDVCAAALVRPRECTAWTRAANVELRDVCATPAAATSAVRVGAMLHRLVVASLSGGGAAKPGATAAEKTPTAAVSASESTAVRLTPDDVAAVFALASDGNNARLFELFPGGPSCAAPVAACAQFVPFAAAANCRLEVCTDDDNDAGRGAAVLRVRCIAGAASREGDSGTSAGPLGAARAVVIKQGERLKMLRRPLLRGADAEAARVALQSESDESGGPRATAQKRSHIEAAKGAGPLPGETAQEAARRRLLGFVGRARQDPTALSALASAHPARHASERS